MLTLGGSSPSGVGGGGLTLGDEGAPSTHTAASSITMMPPQSRLLTIRRRSMVVEALPVASGGGHRGVRGWTPSIAIKGVECRGTRVEDRLSWVVGNGK